MSDDTSSQPQRKSQLKSLVTVVLFAIVARGYLALADYGRNQLRWRGPINPIEWALFLALIFTLSLIMGYLGRRFFTRPIGFLTAVFGGGLGSAHATVMGPIAGALLSLPIASVVALQGERAVAGWAIRSVVVAGVTILFTLAIYPSQAILFLKYPLLSLWISCGLTLVFSMAWWRGNKCLRRNRETQPPWPIPRTIGMIMTVTLVVMWSHFVTMHSIRFQVIGLAFDANVNVRSRLGRRTWRQVGLGEFRVSAISSNDYFQPMSWNAISIIKIAPELSALQLSNNRSIVAKDLACLQYLRQLQDLRVARTLISEDALQYLPPSLKILGFDGKVTDTGIQHILDSDCDLDTLILDRLEASDEMIAKLFSKMPNASTIYLNGAKLGPKSTAALSNLNGLVGLYLVDCQFTPVNGFSLYKMNQLMVLDLTNSNIDVGSLAKSHAQAGLAMPYLTLDGIKLTDGDIAELRKMTIQIQLRMDNTGLTDAQLATLYSGKSTISMVTNLQIQDNKITDAGLQAIAKALGKRFKGPATLRYLDLCGNKGVTIKGLKSLKKLRLDNLMVGDTGVKKAEIKEAKKIGANVYRLRIMGLPMRPQLPGR